MSKTEASAKATGREGIIIFDGSCGACSTFIGRRKQFFESHGFTVAPLQEAWVRDMVGLDETTLSQAIHLHTSNGEILRGIDSLLYFAGKVWWLTPLHLLLQVRILKPLFAKLYDFVAKRRRKISSLCGLQSKALYK